MKNFAQYNKIDESIFKAMLIKMGFSKSDFNTDIQNMSEGQKKKVLIGKSISEQANIYVWDEPLNYIDILTRIQIENTILNYKPTLVFVEHDETFTQKVSTKVVYLKKQVWDNLNFNIIGNPIISRALTELGIVKELNEGVSRTYREMSEFFLEDPIYIEKKEFHLW